MNFGQRVIMMFGISLVVILFITWGCSWTGAKIHKIDTLMADASVLNHQGEIRPDDKHSLSEQYIALQLRHVGLIEKAHKIQDSIIRVWTEQPHDKKHENIANKMIDRYNSLVKPDREMRDSIDFYERLLELKDDTTSKPDPKQKSI